MIASGIETYGRAASGTALPETRREIRSVVVRAGREMAAERGLAFVFRLPVASNARNGLYTAGRLMVTRSPPPNTCAGAPSCARASRRSARQGKNAPDGKSCSGLSRCGALLRRDTEHGRGGFERHIKGNRLSDHLSSRS